MILLMTRTRVQPHNTSYLVGTDVGNAESDADGSELGRSLGTPLGLPDGATEGLRDGLSEGTNDGSSVGLLEGNALGLNDGLVVGVMVGKLVASPHSTLQLQGQLSTSSRYMFSSYPAVSHAVQSCPSFSNEAWKSQPGMPREDT